MSHIERDNRSPIALRREQVHIGQWLISYSIEREQIDGSVSFDTDNYIVEHAVTCRRFERATPAGLRHHDCSLTRRSGLLLRPRDSVHQGAS